MFKNKNVKPKTSTTLENKPLIILVNMVVVVTKNQKNEKPMFKDMELLMNKIVAHWTKKKGK